MMAEFGEYLFDSQPAIDIAKKLTGLQLHARVKLRALDTSWY